VQLNSKTIPQHTIKPNVEKFMDFITYFKKIGSENLQTDKIMTEKSL